jgi:hypothetical protein
MPALPFTPVNTFSTEHYIIYYLSLVYGYITVYTKGVFLWLPSLIIPIIANF